MKHAIAAALSLTMTVVTSAVAGDEVRTIGSFAEMRNMSAPEAEKGTPVELSGVVTFVMPDEGFVLSPSGISGVRDRNAVFVKSDRRIDVARTLRVRGRTFPWENIAAVEAHDIALTGKANLPKPEKAKWSDVRKGWRNLRRVRCVGLVEAFDFYKDDKGGEWTLLTMFGASVRIRGRVDGADLMVGALVEGLGIARNSFDADGRVLAAWFEIASPKDVRIYAPRNDMVYYALFSLLSILAVAALGFCVAWLHSRRKRKEMELVSADRRRIAADLHDTIEQHLAGVKILLSAAAKPENVPDETRKVLDRAAELLIHAKGEVRAAVMDLRGDGAGATLEESLREIAKSDAAAFRFKLRGLPAHLEAARERNLLMIVREAVTNAMKHGRAKTIVIASDPIEHGFALTVANDGEPFDREAALGAATGHFGLAGMDERAHRGKFQLSFGRDGRWTEVRIEVKA